MKTHESAENYLETILILSQRQAAVRSIGIVNELGFSKPGGRVAMRNVRNTGFITMISSGFITLTEEGRKIADMIYERHRLLSRWLIHLGVEETIAVEDACRIEHVISPESFQAIKQHVLTHQGE